jgi:CDGSH iron-sulfur domain-containing protein 3
MSARAVGGKTPIRVEVTAGQDIWWCSCGLSKNQPFCDGSHKTTDLQPMKWTAPETKAVFFGTCKQTKKDPLCDGSHNALAS